MRWHNSVRLTCPLLGKSGLRVPTGHLNYFKDEQFSVVAAVEVLCDQECRLLDGIFSHLVLIWHHSSQSLLTVCMCPAGSDGSREGTACGGGRAAAAQSHGLLVLQRRLWDHWWWRWWGGGSGHRRRVDVRPRGLTRRRVGLSSIYSISRDSIGHRKQTLSSGNATHFPSSMMEMCVTLENAGFVFNL